MRKTVIISLVCLAFFTVACSSNTAGESVVDDSTSVVGVLTTVAPATADVVTEPAPSSSLPAPVETIPNPTTTIWERVELDVTEEFEAQVEELLNADVDNFGDLFTN